MEECSPKADVIICPIAKAQALLKLIKKGGIVEAQKCEPISTLIKDQSVGTDLYFFKVIVFLPQTKFPPSFRSESSDLPRLLLSGGTNRQPCI